MATTATSTATRTVHHLTVAERTERGKTARAAVPRSSQAAFEPAADRADPIDLLEAQAQTRVPELVPIRYGRMLVSPFTFYRGAAKIMATDLARTPTSGLNVQCCGDAHLSNFGVFASPERRLVFDINDFDETLPGPWEWDVKRLAASMLIAARDNGFAAKDQDRIVLDTVTQYRNAMRTFAGMENLTVWYARLDIEEFMQQWAPQFKRSQVKRTEKTLAKARTRDSMSAFSKLTQRTNGSAEIVDQSPLIVPVRALVPEAEAAEMFDGLHKLVRQFRQSLEHDRRMLLEQFELADFARKVVGVGSVGTRAWIALMFGRDGKRPAVPPDEGGRGVGARGVRRQEQVQEPRPAGRHRPALDAGGERHLPGLAARAVGHGRRCPATSTDGSYEIGRARPRSSRWSRDGMAAYGRLCGWTLARAHARSGDRIALASYLGGGNTFDRAILEFSKAYADQNERDYKQLAKAVKSGRIVAQTGL